MIKVESVTEMMFAQAVGLAQNGKMKNTIHCGGSSVFIMNMDNTLLLNFKSPQEFPAPFSFFANDYESPKIEIEDGKVVFITASGGIKRTKVCSAPKFNFKDAKELWDKYQFSVEDSFEVSKAMNTLLEDGLSHIELSKRDGKLLLLQRDIYSGARIEIEKSTAVKSLLDSGAGAEFGPLGVRTVDFNALFSFVDALKFYIQPGKNFLYFEDYSGRLSGILSTCLYDELGYIAGTEGK